MRQVMSASRPEEAFVGGTSVPMLSDDSLESGDDFSGEGFGTEVPLTESSTSAMASTSPADTVSPTFTFNSLMTPASLAGTSIVALSDSSVTRPWSFATVSPGCTSSSITGTSLSSPMSGTFSSMVLAMVFPWGSRRLKRGAFSRWSGRGRGGGRAGSARCRRRGPASGRPGAGRRMPPVRRWAWCRRRCLRARTGNRRA